MSSSVIWCERSFKQIIGLDFYLDIFWYVQNKQHWTKLKIFVSTCKQDIAVNFKYLTMKRNSHYGTVLVPSLV